jgi:hypothetical protein
MTLREIFFRLKKALFQSAEGSGLKAPAKEPPVSESPYTEEEARKVKERLQGLGYIE